MNTPRNEMNIVLISCVKTKTQHRCKAKNLYVSTWFRYAWQYAQSLKPKRIFILSAKHGLLDPDDVIDPYQETLNKKSAAGIRVWAEQVLEKLGQKTELQNDHFTILAAVKYRKQIVPQLIHHEVPMEKKRFGQQLQWLKKHCAK